MALESARLAAFGWQQLEDMAASAPDMLVQVSGLSIHWNVCVGGPFEGLDCSFLPPKLLPALCVSPLS